MNKNEMVQAVKELMEKYSEYRAKWITAKGSDAGFDRWFTQQVYGDAA